MTTTTLTKTIGTILTAIKQVAANSVDITAAPVDVSTALAGLVLIHFARDNTGAPVTGVTFRIEGARASTPAVGDWFVIGSVITGIAAAVTAVMTSTTGAVQTVSSGGASFTAQMIALLKDGTINNSEWARVIVGAATTITCEETLKNPHTTGNIYSQGEMFAIMLDLSGVSRLRVVADGSAHNQTFCYDAALNLNTSLVTA